MNASELRAAATRLRESGYRAERNADMHRDLAPQRQARPLAERIDSAMDQMERTIGITQPSCWPRKRFESRDAAHAASVRIAHGATKYRLPEPCMHCNGWHLA